MNVDRVLNVLNMLSFGVVSMSFLLLGVWFHLYESMVVVEVILFGFCLWAAWSSYSLHRVVVCE